MRLNGLFYIAFSMRNKEELKLEIGDRMDIRKFLTDPAYRFGVLTKLGFYSNMDDAEYLQKLWKVRMGGGY